jgi:isopentenyl-diphosphate delta-isomerase
MTLPEQVVLLDQHGQAVGTADKSTVHHRATPLHLAFSCYVFDTAGSLLVTQRALDKRTWPGVWSNTLCGHPAPGEAIAHAVERRAVDELGLWLTDLRLVLPQFRYVAEMSDGTRENELCPVFVAVADGVPEPSPSEVNDLRWEPWPAFRDGVLTEELDVSPWCRMQVRELAAVELAGGGFPAGDPAHLPPAALGVG